MSGAEAAQRRALEQAIREHEERTTENLSSIRAVREQCESYGRAMTLHTRELEASSAGEDPTNFFVQRRLGARRELELFVGQLVREQAEMLDGVEREFRSHSEDEQEQLRREKARVSWG